MIQLDIEGERFAKPSLPHAPGCYRVIAADPAWTFVTRSAKGKGRSPEQHYSCMSIAEIKALPVADIAAPDSVLFLWVTDPHLQIGLDVMEAWGFRYSTVAFTWVKLQASLAGWSLKQIAKCYPDLAPAFFMGCGYWTRANPEMCLLGVRGHPERNKRDVRQLIIDPRREHSRKPDEAYARMRRLVKGPAIELFARTGRTGWHSWGNETEKFSDAA